MAPPPKYAGPVSLASSKYAPVDYKGRLAATVPSPAQDPVPHERNVANGTGKHEGEGVKPVSALVWSTHELLGWALKSARKECGDPCVLLDAEESWTKLEQFVKGAQEINPVASSSPRRLERTAGEADNRSQSGEQKALGDYKAQTESLLKEIVVVQDRFSRLTLEHGTLKVELDKCQQKLAQENSGRSEAIKQAELLKAEIQSLIDTKKSLVAEADTLRQSVAELQENLQAKEKKISDHYEKEITRLTENLRNEGNKINNLDTLVQTLRSGEDRAKKEGEKWHNEFKLMSEKFKNQGIEFSKKFNAFNEQTNMVSDLKAQCDRLEKQLVDTKGKADRFKQELVVVSENLNKENKSSENLELKNNELQEQQKKDASELTALRAENLKLSEIVQDVKNKSAAADTTETVALQEKLRAAEAEVQNLQEGLDEWKTMATRSYDGYKQMLAHYKEGQKQIEEAESLRTEVSNLKAQLAEATKKGGGNGGDIEAAYWKDKYENLLATYGD